MILRIRPSYAVLALFAFIFASATLQAQVQATAPVTTLPQYQQRWDFYGGYSYSHFNPGQGRGVQAINLNGWNGDATAWFKQLFGLEFSARGYYGTIIVPPNAYSITKSNMSEYLFLVGPNFRLLRRENYAAGLHGLIGAANGFFDQGFKNSGIQPNQVGIYNNKLAFGAAVGGWADYNLNPKWAVRVTADWQPTHYGFSTQNEFSGTAGVVYKFGYLK
ncbi:hypothetical protein [Alloacidobacterium sp.]|uniref:hypothetical protein n=1 Tax=Alloacidobacterium sp. TaxID=2951999 RepID=UPI002D682E8C|nr:hypothetical protein [Alloacidobacterium sp.]HYK35721.1 hypothetical protein [Alloacidobacterium sp.]